MIERLRARAAPRTETTLPAEQLSLAVIGASFDNPRRKGNPTGNRNTEILMFEPGEAVTLVLEPRNKHDRNAIAVFSSRKVQIGYIVADRTILLHKAWQAARDVRAIFQEPITGGAAIRVAFDRDPVLPPVKLADRPAPRRRRSAAMHGMESTSCRLMTDGPALKIEVTVLGRPRMWPAHAREGKLTPIDDADWRFTITRGGRWKATRKRLVP